MSPKVSVIIVNYHSRLLTEKLIKNLQAGQFTDYETIVIDNDFQNLGYGRAANLGAKHSLGEYLYITNPDTQPFFYTLSRLVHFLDTHPQAGLVAPLLLSPTRQPYPLQGTTELTPLSAIFALSYINKYWPNNPVSHSFWLFGWDKRRDKSVGVAPGTAFLVRRQVFIDLSGFDPKFFLYFEESDLCRRLKIAGWDIYIHPPARLIHFWGHSTSDSPHIKAIFSQSRRYYFTKHFGHFWSFLVHLVVK